MSDDDYKPLPAFEDRAPSDRYCDLILTGGVTSAVAYPTVIFGLARAYRFNCIGGSSSGAGCAALAAAAEYRRRHGSSEGFRILLERTAALADMSYGRTGLAWLFQPEPYNRRLFHALVRAFAAPRRKLWELFLGLVRAYAIWILLGVALGVVVWTWCGALGFSCDLLSLSTFFAVLAAGIALACDVASLGDTDFGLCSGTTRQAGAEGPPPLTDWLHALIQEIAGRPGDGEPLTFADLHAAPGSPRATLGDESEAGGRSINLEMFAANVTHGRPYLLPRSKSSAPLYFKPGEMKRLFPPAVVEHLIDQSPDKPAQGKPDDDALLELPREHLPIVVAARMSVSFPVLFSAVPLWANEELSQPRHGPPRLSRCLFSDGGICSNFPIHLFDSALPAWPTFGISLHSRDAHDSDARAGAAMTPAEIEASVSLPDNPLDGRQERWDAFAAQRCRLLRILGFVGAIVSTAKDWNDATLARLPGVHDRVARIELAPQVGGLNILMKPAQIKDLARLGGEAARRLLLRFSKADGSGGVAAGWNEHRWVRFNLLRDCLSTSLAGLGRSAGAAQYAQTLTAQIRDPQRDALLHRVNPDLEPGARLADAQAAALEGALAALLQAERALTAPTVGQPGEPHPRPAMRIRPTL